MPNKYKDNNLWLETEAFCLNKDFLNQHNISKYISLGDLEELAINNKTRHL